MRSVGKYSSLTILVITRSFSGSGLPGISRRLLFGKTGGNPSEEIAADSTPGIEARPDRSRS